MPKTSNRTEIENGVKEILDIYTNERIEPEFQLRGDIGLDSVDMLELVFELQNKFDIDIEDEEAAKFITVKHVVDSIETKLKGGNN